MAGFARIPIIEQTVPTPSGFAPRREPVAQPEGFADLAGAAQSVGQLGRVLQVQGAHQAILDADTAEENFKNAIQESYAKAKVTLPGSQWATTVDQEGAGIAQKMLDDPVNAHIRPYLQKRLPQLLSVIKGDATISGAVATAKQQDDQFKGLQGKMAAQAGADFKVNPNGTFADGPIAQAVRSKNESMIQALWGQNPEAAQQHRQLFEDRVTLERGQAIARNNPALLGDFLNANSDKFTPQEQGQLMTVATTAINAPMRQIDANRNAARAQAIQYQNDYIQQNGQPDMARLNHDAQLEIIKPEDFRGFTGRDYQMPTDPATLALYRNQIAGARDEEELQEIKSNIRAAAGFKLINGGTVPQLEGEADARIRYYKSDAGQEVKTAKDQIPRAYQNMGQNAFIYNKIAAVQGLPTIPQLQANAERQFEAHITPNATRAQIHDAWTKAIRDNQPDFEAAGIKVKAPKPATMPPMNDEALLKAARDKGIIR